MTFRETANHVKDRFLYRGLQRECEVTMTIGDGFALLASLTECLDKLAS